MATPTKSQNVRILSDEDIEKLTRQNNRLVSEFNANKLEINAQKHWDYFYKRNKTNFFKDRHWTTREFHDLLGDNLEQKILLEIGCGVGNLIYPLLEENPNLTIVACDFSERAVNFVREHPLYNPLKVTVFQADLTSDDFPQIMLTHSKLADVVTLVFVLSAIHPDNFKKCIENISKSLTPGGVVLFRDYGLHDMTQIRFKPGHKIEDNFYMRQDGTRSYFFTVEKIRSIFINTGFTEIDCYYVHNRTVNIKESVDVPRTYVQAKFQKCV